jgi:PHP family Zn ribbon phosphoesterase
MTPSALVSRACSIGLDLIAICDHNSAENVGAARCCARERGLAVIGGMEVTTREEVHVLGLFHDQDALDRAQELVHAALHEENDPVAFGEQLIIDEHDQLLGQSLKLLIGATDFSLEQTVEHIHRLGGVAIAAHIDRPSFSLISQVGFVPPDLPLDAVELCYEALPPSAAGLPVLRSSDAHRLEEIGRRSTRFLVEEATLSELELAIRGSEGRQLLDR